MEVAHPLRIFVVGPPDSDIPRFIKDLTGTDLVVPPAADSIAGLSHELRISNKYYSATVPIWIDEITDLREWEEAYSGPEALEVLRAIGAFVIVFKRPVDRDILPKVKEMLEAVQSCGDRSSGAVDGFEGVCLAVAMPQSSPLSYDVDEQQWEAECVMHGFEYVDFPSKRDEENREPSGLERIKQALEAHSWRQPGDGDDEDDFNDFGGVLDEEDEGFRLEAGEVQRELLGLRTVALADTSENESNDNFGPWQEGTDDKAETSDGASHQKLQMRREDGLSNPKAEQEVGVEQMESMLRQITVAKEMGSVLSEAERKKHARRAVNEIMKSF